MQNGCSGRVFFSSKSLHEALPFLHAPRIAKPQIKSIILDPAYPLDHPDTQAWLLTTPMREFIEAGVLSLATSRPCESPTCICLGSDKY